MKRTLSASNNRTINTSPLTVNSGMGIISEHIEYVSLNDYVLIRDIAQKARGIRREQKALRFINFILWAEIFEDSLTQSFRKD